MIYKREQIPELVEERLCRRSGDPVVLYDARFHPDFEEADGRWVLGCEVDQSYSPRPTLQVARNLLAFPDLWCEACSRRLVDQETFEQAVREEAGIETPLRFLDPEQAARPYRKLLRPGCSLHGAIAAPVRLAHYERLEDPCKLAGSLLWAVTRAHALTDGNKRASIILADLFLRENGLRLEGEDDALYALAYDAAASSVSESTIRYRLSKLTVEGGHVDSFELRYPDVIHRLAQ